MDQLWGIVRTLLLAGGGFAVSKGYIDNDTMIAVVGAIVVIASALWGFFHRAAMIAAPAK